MQGRYLHSHHITEDQPSLKATCVSCAERTCPTSSSFLVANFFSKHPSSPAMAKIPPNQRCRHREYARPDWHSSHAERRVH
ncbi:hypothetical protein F2P79_002541 [Pimephales promelas]|nr:hypothetical protein F2P79_002541 [Pimephales promelas]